MLEIPPESSYLHNTLQEAKWTTTPRRSCFLFSVLAPSSFQEILANTLFYYVFTFLDSVFNPACSPGQ